MSVVRAPRPASYSARTSASARQRRPAQQDRPPGLGDRAVHPAVAGGRGVPRPRDVLAAGPARRLVEERVLVEVGVGGEPVGRRAVAEDRPDRRPEHLGQVEVDGPHGPVEVDLLVHEPARRQEHLERPEARLVQRQAAVRDERVAAQPLDVDRPDRDARSGTRRGGRSRGCRP